MTSSVQGTLLNVLWALALGGCGAFGGGGGGGARAADDVAGSSADRTRIRAAIEALGRELGHPVNVQVDAALVEGKPTAPARVAELVEDLTREVASVNPASPRGCRHGCSASTSLAMSVDARSLWANVQRIELRYDVSPPKVDRRSTEYAPSTGTLTFRIPPDGLFGAVDAVPARRVVFHGVLEPRFRGRPPASITPAELPQYVLFLTESLDRAEDARNAVPFVYVYPRLVDPALSVARERLVAARSFIDDTWAPTYGSPELEQAWALWYRTYASTLEERRLREAAHVVFNRARGDLPGLPAFEHGFGLLAAEAQKRGTPESAVLACAQYERCYGPLWDYLVDRRYPDRRQRLAAALLATRSPAFVEFVALRLFEQRDANKPELLALLSSDPASWTAAFAVGLLSLNAVPAEVLLDIWRANPALRAPMLRTIGVVATVPPRGAPGRSIASIPYADTPVGHASRALNGLAFLCATPDRATFIALATANIPRDNPVWKGRHATGGRACDGP